MKLKLSKPQVDLLMFSTLEGMRHVSDPLLEKESKDIVQHLWDKCGTGVKYTVLWDIRLRAILDDWGVDIGDSHKVVGGYSTLVGLIAHRISEDQFKEHVWKLAEHKKKDVDDMAAYIETKVRIWVTMKNGHHETLEPQLPYLNEFDNYLNSMKIEYFVGRENLLSADIYIKEKEVFEYSKGNRGELLRQYPRRFHKGVIQ